MVVVVAAVVAISAPVAAVVVPMVIPHTTQYGPPGGCAALAEGSGPVLTVSIQESGLPAGTAWVAEFDRNGSNRAFCTEMTNGTTINFSAVPGTYNYTVNNVTTEGMLYIPTPVTALLTLSETNLTVSVNFSSLGLDTLEFVETGLPAGTIWEVQVAGGPSIHQDLWTYNTTLSFSIPAGEYRFVIVNDSLLVNRIEASPQTGYVNMTASLVIVNVTFTTAPGFFVSFEETGLPVGVSWSVGLSNPWTNLGMAWSGPTIQFDAPNGTYNFTIANSSNFTTLYAPSVSHGTIHVNGSSIVIPVTFQVVPTYSLIFNETGLPNGTNWTAIVTSPAIAGGGYTGRMDGSTCTVDLLPAGTYSYSFWTQNGMTAAPATGTVTLSGSDVTVSVSFS